MTSSPRFDELDSGFSWVMGDALERTSHALLADGKVWLVDPVDEPVALERAAALGEFGGVIQLLDRHNRDCAGLASRLRVPHHKTFGGGGSAGPFQVIKVVSLPVWKEAALWWAPARTLVVAEAVGTHPLWAVGNGPAGIHPMLRVRPPRGLAAYAPEHLLVGHGAGVHGRQTTTALQDALARSRRDLPRMLLKLPSMRRH